MPKTYTGAKRLPVGTVSFSNTATTMIASLFANRPAEEKRNAIKTIKIDIGDPEKVRKLDGYDNLYIARGHGMRVVFKREGKQSKITAVSAEG